MLIGHKGAVKIVKSRILRIPYSTKTKTYSVANNCGRAQQYFNNNAKALIKMLLLVVFFPVETALY